MLQKLDPEIVKNLQDVNWAYSWYDSISEEIFSNIETLKKEYEKSDSSMFVIFRDHADILRFKTKEVYNTLMKMHLLLFQTSSGFYKKYHGPFREELGEGIFEEVKREVIYSMESFLTQLKSLIDISIRFAFKVTTIRNPTNEPDVDSLGLLDHAHRSINRFRNTWNIIKRFHYFTDFVAQKKALFDIQNYRDLIVHEDYLKLQISPMFKEGEILFKYRMPIVTGKKRQRTISQENYIDIIQFSREKFYLTLSILVNLTKRMFSTSIKKTHFTALLKMPHYDVSKAIRKLAVTGNLADKTFIKQSELEQYLIQHKIDPNELIEYKKSENESRSKVSDWIDKVERIHYVPIKGLQVYKVRMSFGKPNDLRIGEWTYGILKTDTQSEDLSEIKNIDEILEHLQGCGLIFTSTNNQKTFGPLREDLKNLVLHLLGINQEKWIFQIESHQHIKLIPAVEEHLKKSYGDKYEEHKKKEEFERQQELDKYKQWKKDPYKFAKLYTIVDKQKKVINRITYQDFKDEKQRKFVNWNKNLIIRSGTAIKDPLFTSQLFSQTNVRRLISGCRRAWKKKPYNYLDFWIKQIKKMKKEYEEQVKKTKTDYKNIIRRYSVLKPVLRLINPDVYSDHVDYDKINPGLFESR